MNHKASYSYSNQFLRMLEKSVSSEQFSKISAKYGPFELESYHPNQRVEIEVLSAILESLPNDADLATRIGRAVEVGQFGSASYYALSCSTIFEVFRFYARFYELLICSKETIDISLTKQHLQVKINAPFTKRKGDFMRYEMLVSMISTAIQFSAGQQCIPERIELPIVSADDSKRLEKLFNSTVESNRDTIILHYGAHWLGQRLANENPAMRQILRADLDAQLLQLRAHHSLVEQIHIYLEKANFSTTTQVSVANYFNMSESTFKRRLKSESTNFKSILQSFKQTRSLHLLSNDRNKFDSIALELGFSERASFERAFKTWYGMTPAQFRELARLCQITGPIEQILSQENLPASPVICQRIVEITSHPEYDIDELSSAISSDPVLTGKIIGLSNSALYGGITKVSNLQQAIVKLGVNQVKSIAMGILANNAAGGNETLPIDMKRYWSSALTTAHWAQQLGRLQPELKQDSESLFLAGLLHNIGLVLLATLRPDQMTELIPQLADHPTLKDKADLEKRVFGVSRYSASAILLAHWGLPVDLITIIHGIIQVIHGEKSRHLASQLVYQIVRYQVSHHTKDSEQEELEAFTEHLARVINIDTDTVREAVAKLLEAQGEIDSLAAMLASD